MSYARATLDTYPRDRPRLACDFLALHEPEPWDEYFALVDLPRAVGADFEVGGRRYGLFGHDFRRVPVDALTRLWTERAPAQDPRPPPAPPDEAMALSHEHFTDAVRQALRDLHRVDPLARNTLLRTRLVAEYGGAHAPGAQALAALLRTAVDALGDHPRDDRLLRAVERTYVQRVPTQEAAAEVLGLPWSTYRRHLPGRAARDRLALGARALRHDPEWQ